MPADHCLKAGQPNLVLALPGKSVERTPKPVGRILTPNGQPYRRPTPSPRKPWFLCAIVLALIPALATIVVALLKEDESTSNVPVIVTAPPIIVTVPDGPNDLIGLEKRPPPRPFSVKAYFLSPLPKSPHGYYHPPQMQIAIDDADVVPSDSLVISVSSLSPNHDRLQTFELENRFLHSPSRTRSGEHLTIQLDSDTVIQEYFTGMMCGIYHFTFESVNAKGKTASASLQFRHVYREDFADLGQALRLEEYAHCFGNIPGSTGLRMSNPTGSEGYISGILNGRLPCRTDFFIRGVFTQHANDRSRPVGLDIAVCDPAQLAKDLKERLTHIFPDGSVRKGSTKLNGQPYGPPATQPFDGAIQAIKQDGRTEHEFLIRVREIEPGLSRSELFLSRHAIDPDTDRPARIVEFPSSQIGDGHAIIYIKSWKAGIIDLLFVEVGLLVSDE